MLLRRPRRPIDLLTWTNSSFVNLLGAAPAAAPFFQIDWPNPRGKQFPVDLRTFTNAAEIHLIGRDVFYAGAGQVPTHSIPNPRGPLYPIALRTFTQNARVDLIGKDTFYAGAGVGPDFDYPNPTLRKSSIASINAQPVYNTLATGLLATPFYRNDWPVPKGKAFPSDLRGFVRASDTRLIGQDVFFAGAGVGPDYDYPNPTLRKSSTAAISSQPIPNNQGTTLFVQTTPFAQTEHPNPTLAKYNQNRMGFVQAARVDLVGKDVFFAGAGQVQAVDAPNPAPKKRTVQPEIPPNLLAAGMLAAPFIQQEQPNRFAAKPQARIDGVPNLLTTTLGTVAAPFSQDDFPNPTRRVNRIVADHQLGNVLIQTTVFPVGKQEFRTPYGPKPREQAGFLHASDTRLIGQDVFYGGAGRAPVYDWPNPQQRRSSHQAVNSQPSVNRLASAGGGLLMLRRRHNATL